MSCFNLWYLTMHGGLLLRCEYITVQNRRQRQFYIKLNSYKIDTLCHCHWPYTKFRCMRNTLSLAWETLFLLFNILPFLQFWCETLLKLETHRSSHARFPIHACSQRRLGTSQHSKVESRVESFHYLVERVTVFRIRLESSQVAENSYNSSPSQWLDIYYIYIL
jgi:hypothetical protein